MTTPDIYQKLAAHLDNLPGGFASPQDENGQRILRRLFTPEQAELALHLNMIGEEPRVIAHRANIPVDEAAALLDEMSLKGLIYRSVSAEGRPTYMAFQFVVGIWEAQVNNLSPELVHDVDQFLHEHFDFDVWQKSPQMRTIPVGESITTGLGILPYEQAETLVLGEEKISLTPCICRKERNLVGLGCEKPLETCMGFGEGADFYIDNGLGRAIDQQTALEVLRTADEAGLVLQVGNAKAATFICCCCGDCCGVLRNLKRHPKPAEVAASPFYAEVDEGLCDACATCEERCQMEAIHVNGFANVDLSRCIGCGLCVTTCPTQAVSLVRKPEAETPAVPTTYANSLIQLGKTRGKLSNAELVKMMARSKADRLMALQEKK
jgi:electron transport complex protein RnfB